MATIFYCGTLFCLHRWNEKFDFVMIPANSVLLATVWDQTSLVEAATSLKISTVSTSIVQAEYRAEFVLFLKSTGKAARPEVGDQGGEFTEASACCL